MRYLIWSNQKHQWWRPNGLGYTDVIDEAGRYDAEYARRIVAGATVDGQLVHRRTDPVTGRAYDMLDEVMVPAPDPVERVTQAMSYGDIAVTLLQPEVIVEQAPDEARISLELLVGADRERLFCRGARLYLGNDRAGAEVVYQVAGWDDAGLALIVRRVP